MKLIKLSAVVLFLSVLTAALLIPDRLLQFAGLKYEVVMIGVRDHLELWDAERWQNYLAQNAPRFDSVAEAAFGA